MASEALDGLSVVRVDFGVRVELPDEDALITTGSDEDLSVFIFLLGVPSFDTGDPVGVSLKMSNFLGDHGAFLSHHKIIFIK